MSHRKSDLGIPCSEKSAKVVLVARFARVWVETGISAAPTPEPIIASMAIIAVAASKVLEAHSVLDEQRLQRRAIKNLSPRAWRTTQALASAWRAFSSISVARRPCGQFGTVRRCTPAGAQSRRRSALEDPQTSGGC